MKYFAVLILISVLLFSSCQKDEDRIPYVSVNVYIDINNANYNNLNAIGGYVYLTGGYKGLIVYRASYESFVAIERACPYHPTGDCDRLVVDTSGLTVSDSVCGSRFLITDGSIVNGPATRPAATYSTIFDGFYVRIYN
jgi:nitrite reductase/ring-hydroxylating ferredoxin subunit